MVFELYPIQLFTLIAVVVPQAKAIVHPPPPHQLVQENHLGRHVEEVEELQAEELVGVPVALRLELAVALQQLLHPRLPRLPLQLRLTHSEGAEHESPALKTLPDLPRSVEHQRLGEN